MRSLELFASDVMPEFVVIRRLVTVVEEIVGGAGRRPNEPVLRAAAPR